MKKRIRGSEELGRRATAARKRQRPRPGLRAFVGMFASRTADLASRHDEHLYDRKKPGP